MQSICYRCGKPVVMSLGELGAVQRQKVQPGPMLTWDSKTEVPHAVVTGREVANMGAMALLFNPGVSLSFLFANAAARNNTPMSPAGSPHYLEPSVRNTWPTPFQAYQQIVATFPAAGQMVQPSVEGIAHLLSFSAIASFVRDNANSPMTPMPAEPGWTGSKGY